MLAKKRALGRGLDALLGSEEPEKATTETPAAPEKAEDTIPIVDLQPNPYQPRRQFNAERLEELAASIEKNGILQPIVVRRVNEHYEIVAGERRWRAAQRVGLQQVPVVLRDFNNQEMLALALIENLQREDLNPVEEARAYQQLIQEFHFSQEQVADQVGKSRVAVTNSIRLLRLPDQILGWIEEGAISAGHARTLLSLDKEALQTAMAREIMGHSLSVRETEKRVRKLLKAPDPSAKAPRPDIEIQTGELEEKLCLHLGLQVKIFPKSNSSGKVEVYYSSLDEFQRLFDHLGISLEQEV